MGLAVFTLASLASGCARNGAELIGARALQGAAAALLTPSALSLVMTTYSGDQRKKGLALWGAVGSLGVAAGALVGAFITTTVGWEYIFWVNGPVGLVGLLVGVRLVPRTRTVRESPSPPTDAEECACNSASRPGESSRRAASCITAQPSPWQTRPRCRHCWRRPGDVLGHDYFDDNVNDARY